jgi:hypothetical protein
VGKALKPKSSSLRRQPTTTPRSEPVETAGLSSGRGEEPQLTALVWEVSEAFRKFAKRARKLSRMASKSGGPVSSEGYNYLVQEQIRELNRTFAAYMKSRDDMRYYVQSTYWRSKYYTHGFSSSAALKRDQPEKMRQSFRTAS